MALSPAEIERYARHIVLREIGGPGQQKLKAARVLVIGAGGLGAPAIQYLAAVGIGRLGLVDDDTVSLSNLQRQVIHDTAVVGRLKVESAAESVRAINPHVGLDLHPVRLAADNAADLVRSHDVVVDGSDNFATRYLLADTCEAEHRPLVTAAVGTFDGTITTLVPYAKAPDGLLNPSYRDLFPEPPPPGTVPTCAEAGVVGALPGILGSLQAMEVIKLICGIGEPLIGRLLMVDALAMRFDTVRFRRRRPSVD